MLTLFSKFGYKQIGDRDKPRQDGQHLWLDFVIEEHEWPTIKAKMEAVIWPSKEKEAETGGRATGWVLGFYTINRNGLPWPEHHQYWIHI
jgi:hypothetical protein